MGCVTIPCDRFGSWGGVQGSRIRRQGKELVRTWQVTAVQAAELQARCESPRGLEAAQDVPSSTVGQAGAGPADWREPRPRCHQHARRSLCSAENGRARAVPGQLTLTCLCPVLPQARRHLWEAFPAPVCNRASTPLSSARPFPCLLPIRHTVIRAGYHPLCGSPVRSRAGGPLSGSSEDTMSVLDE